MRETLIVLNSFRGSKDCKYKDLKFSSWQNESGDEKNPHTGPQLNDWNTCHAFEIAEC